MRTSIIFTLLLLTPVWTMESTQPTEKAGPNVDRLIADLQADDPDTIDAAERALCDASPTLVLEHVDTLIALLDSETYATVDASRTVLEHMDTLAVPALEQAYPTAKPVARAQILCCFANLELPRKAHLKLMAAALDDSDAYVNEIAHAFIGRFGKIALPYVPALREALNGPDADLRSASLLSLCYLARYQPTLLDDLAKIADEPSLEMRETLAINIGASGRALWGHVPLLVKLLEDPAPRVRYFTVIAVRFIGWPATAATETLCDMAANDPDPDLRDNALWALEAITPPPADVVPALQAIATDPNAEADLKLTAVRVLALYGNDATQPAQGELLRMLTEALAAQPQEQNPPSLHDILMALDETHPPADKALPLIERIINNDTLDEDTRFKAVWSLTHVDDPDNKTTALLLKTAATPEQTEVALPATVALSLRPSLTQAEKLQAASAAIEILAQSESTGDRRAMILAVGRLGIVDNKTKAAVLETLQSSDTDLCCDAMRAAAALKLTDDAILSRLQTLAEDESFRLRSNATLALARLTGDDDAVADAALKLLPDIQKQQDYSPIFTQRVIQPRALEALVVAWRDGKQPDRDRLEGNLARTLLMASRLPDMRDAVYPYALQAVDACRDAEMQSSLLRWASRYAEPAYRDVALPIFKAHLLSNDASTRAAAIQGIRRIEPDFDIAPVLKQALSSDPDTYSDPG